MTFTPTLQITDLTTTVNLNNNTDGSLRDDSYVPGSPQAGEDGAYPTAVSEAPVIIMRGGKAAIEANIANLNRLFQQARDYRGRRVGSRVYVQYKLATGDTLYRSEIKDGRVAFDPAELSVLSINGIMDAVVGWTRRHYWESTVETELALTNGNGTDVTGGINVFNCNDGVGSPPNKQHNYVQIAAASLAGDLPSPARLALLNTHNDADKLDKVWAAHNVNSDPANLTHILEAEAGTGGTPTVDATCSGGNRNDLAVTASNSELLTWTLSSALLSDCLGNYFTLLARFAFANSANINNTKFQLKLKDATGVVWTGPQIRPDTTLSYAILPLGTVRLPPRPTEGTSSALTLALWAQTVSGSHAVSLDFLQLSTLDSWRVYERVGDALAFNDRLVDDAILNLLYVDTGDATARRSTLRAVPGPIMLIPNKLQRLYFLQHTSTAYVCEIDRKISARVYYRPRRSAF